MPCKRFSNAWAISHYGVSGEEIWQLFPLKNQDAPSAALNWTMNAQVLRVPTTALITLVSELVLKTLFMPQGVLCSCSELSFRTCVWEVGCIMRHSPILCPHLYVGGFEQAAAHLSLKKALKKHLFWLVEQITWSFQDVSAAPQEQQNPWFSFLGKWKNVSSKRPVTPKQRSYWPHTGTA